MQIYFKEKKDIFYVADSLGCMRPQDINSVFKKLKILERWTWNSRTWQFTYALKIFIANKNHGVNWLDSTVLGMGRGPGNLKTEEIINYSKEKNKYQIKNLSKKIFPH